jgi:hypothetical protein
MQFVAVAGEIEPVHQIFDIEGGKAQGHTIGFRLLLLSNRVQLPAGLSPVQEPVPTAEYSPPWQLLDTIRVQEKPYPYSRATGNFRANVRSKRLHSRECGRRAF